MKEDQARDDRLVMEAMEKRVLKGLAHRQRLLLLKKLVEEGKSMKQAIAELGVPKGKLQAHIAILEDAMFLYEEKPTRLGEEAFRIVRRISEDKVWELRKLVEEHDKAAELEAEGWSKKMSDEKEYKLGLGFAPPKSDVMLEALKKDRWHRIQDRAEGILEGGLLTEEGSDS